LAFYDTAKHISRIVLMSCANNAADRIDPSAPIVHTEGPSMYDAERRDAERKLRLCADVIQYGDLFEGLQ
jgi:hypothetical protein